MRCTFLWVVFSIQFTWYYAPERFRQFCWFPKITVRQDDPSCFWIPSCTVRHEEFATSNSYTLILLLLGVSPVLRFGTHGQRLNPFLDVGVGVSIGSRTTLLNRDFGSRFFFSPTAGAGVKFGSSASGISLFVRWLHHSNADLFPPNEGIDSLYVLLGYRF